MNKTDTSKYKPRLREYINKKGIPIESTDADRITCPGHDDKKPSAILYDEIIFCPVCDTKLDIFAFSGLYNNLGNFPAQLSDVQNTLGIVDNSSQQNYKKPANTSTKNKEPSKIVPLSPDKAREKFTPEKMLSMSAFIGKMAAKKAGVTCKNDKEYAKHGYGDKIAGAWPYKNEAGQVEIIDVRFEGGPKKKAVITFYYDGKNVKSKQPPVCVYNRDLIAKYPDHTILIVEGAKAAKIATDALLEFGILPITWNGGTSKILLADWKCIHNRNVFVFPDDDKPGIKAADIFSKEHGALIDDFKIIPPYEPAREIKKQGADIVEVLQLLKPKELSEYIKNSDNYEIKGAPEKKDPPAEPGIPQNKPGPVSNFEGAPFRILGTAEDGQAYFLDRAGRLYNSKLDNISRNKLQMLASVHYWKFLVGTNKLTNDDWLYVADDIIEVSSKTDFSLDNIRGRGAWKEEDGRICFHDGQKTIGEYDENRVFLKKPPIDIGLGCGPINQETIDKIKKITFELSFETQSDAMRLLAWCSISPFSGALKYRPQAFLTGGSGVGKSSIDINIIKPLAVPDRYNAGKTSAPGYMQSRLKDSGAVVFDEADKDTETKKKYVTDMLSVMRQSTSDDTPKSAMGTADQTGRSYMTRDMFMFIAIDPTIESNADDNRMTKINLIPPKKNGRSWPEIEKELQNNFTKTNCKAIRSEVWKNLKKIVRFSDNIAAEIQKVTGKPHRFAISEGLLMSVYLIVWKGISEPTDAQIEDFVSKNYELKKPEDDRDDTQEIIDRILEYRVKVYLKGTKEFNVLEVLKILKTGKLLTGKPEDLGGESEVSTQDYQEYKRSVNNIGIAVDPDGNMAIANEHIEIKKIIGRQNKYSRILKRHPGCIDTSKVVSFIDKSRRCTVIENIIEVDQEDLPF